MFGYSMVQAIRTYANKIDQPLREQMLYMYRPFTWIPCFMHNTVERFIKKMKKVSVIIEFSQDTFENDCQELHQFVESHTRCCIRKTFSFVSCCSIDATPAMLEDILSKCPQIKRIYLNRKVQALLDVATPAIGAEDIVRNNTTLSGKGVTIAVIDTGIHPHQDIDGRIIDFVDLVNQKEQPYDDNGHGTHCAGDAAGNGAASNGKYKGPAYEADLIGVKVLDKMGSGTLESIMSGIDWCLQYNMNNPDKKIDVISMSLGATAQKYEQEDKDPMVQSVEKAWENGLVVCVAAGNSGPDAQTIASPGVSDRVITVGAYEDNDTVDNSDDDVASFSSRGPTVYGVQKPDILAPGVNIVSLRSPNSYIDKLQKSSRVDGDYFVMSGTSMATPICAGVVALMLQHNPAAEPDKIKQMLIDGAEKKNDLDPNIYGHGFINAKNSIPE
ncbi:S8 family peptidase [Pseudalkalibacillus salsuginis]|uniref:S8 family peptidase n=1 Tax=Pseudalkalibacillus salsuginis TaxID=2910972 RepID=UPI001F28A75C|nr:S8 family peptidase [Pseudalkalibacillus salsuginis]MCF6410807.1 S8 family peptidase [Pseudalkalibacillus salsuginis]